MVKVNVKFLKRNPNAKLPKYAHDGDLGMDVVATGVEYDAKTDSYIYSTGLSCETKKGVGVYAFARSSIYSTDCYLTNSVGVIDSAQYRGEIKFVFKNRTSLNARIELQSLREWTKMNWFEKLFTSYDEVYNKNSIVDPLKFAPYAVGDKIGQLILMEFPVGSVKEAKKLSETERGEGGFGSTGK